ncbi:MAG: site-specific DNA-methyltransferase [Ignavibacteria bacterium]|nr:site-specific DNA-methyltransferase [Ignavibacteria bacterium]
MEYKLIELETNNFELSNKNRIVNHFNSVYSREDLYFDLKDDKLLIYLRQLDFFTFKDNVEKLLEGKSEDEEAQLISGIFKKIDSIKSYGIKSKKRLYVNYNKERKVANRQAKEKKRTVAFYSKNNEFSKNNNPVPEEYINCIIASDSETFLKKLPDNCIDIILTSPPYNFGLDYESTDDDHKWEKYFDKLFAIFDECIRVLKYGGRILINIQPLYSDYIPSHHIISNYFMQKKLIWKTEIIWQKNNYSAKFSSWGSWKSPSNPYLKGTWEFIEVFCKGTMKKDGLKENIDITKEEFKKWVNAEWSIAPERNMKKYDHPAMFPEELVRRAIKLFSYKNDIVLDPFNGAGTTTFVAKQQERRFIGIDISEQYCNTAKNRLEELLF